MSTANVASETVTVHPLRAAIATAERAHAFASAWDEALCADDSIDAEDPRYLAVSALWDLADDQLDAARAAIAGSDCPREWQLQEGDCGYDTVIATSARRALKIARGNVDRANYSEAEGTLYIDVRVHCRETDEEDSDTVTLAEEEPECTESAHDWQAPHEIVGGIEENPGVWGHGGGVIIHEVCVHCGCGRTTDTWAQRHDTGEQGLTEVSYHPGKYTESVDSRDVDAERADYDVSR